MKQIKAFVRPSKFEIVHRELKKNGLCCITITECEGTGRYTDPDKEFPSISYPFLHNRIVKLEMIISDDTVDKAIEIIHNFGSTGKKGDGLIAVIPVEKTIKVRTGEMET